MIHQISVILVSAIVIFINNFISIIIIGYNSNKPLGYQTLFDKLIERLLIMNAIIPYLKSIIHYCCAFSITFDYWIAFLICCINNYCVSLLIAWFFAVIVFKNFYIFHPSLVDFEMSDQKIVQKIQYFIFISITIFSGIDYTFITDMKNMMLYKLLTGKETSSDSGGVTKLNQIFVFFLIMAFTYTQIRIKKEGINLENNRDNKDFKKNLKLAGIFVLVALIMRILVFNVVEVSDSTKVLYGSFLMMVICHVLPLFIFIVRSSDGMKGGIKVSAMKFFSRIFYFYQCM